MTFRIPLIIAVSAGWLWWAASPASADCEYAIQTVYVQGAPQVSAVLQCDDTGTSSGTESVADNQPEPPCLVEAIQVLLDPTIFCPADQTSEVDEVTPGMVAAALRVIPLPPSELQVQPANGRTLVNFETNFYTDAAPFGRTVTLLGQRVDLHIVPSGFGWRFGDGEVLTTADAGAPYPDLRVTHDYQRKGRVSPAVDTTYTATYRVNGGPWADVPGSVTIPGVPVGLEVLTATPVLVGSG